MSALSPAVLAATHDLELAARLVVEGLRSGNHRSPLHGYSAEFQQHRPYRSGDDLKYLDWKVLARTDRLYSRQFRETTSMSVMIVLDTSPSMAFPQTASQLSKFRYASIVAAAVAYMISTQGDAVGLMTSSDGRFEYLPPRGGRPHLRSLIARIDRLQPRDVWQPEQVIARAAELMRRRGLVLVLSDFYDAEDTTRTALRRVLRRGHDVGMLQVISAEERNFPFAGDLELHDLESDHRLLLNAAEVKPQYQARFNTFLEHCRSNAARDGIDYHLFASDLPPEQTLREWLLRRGSTQAAHSGGPARSGGPDTDLPVDAKHPTSSQ